MCCVAVSWPINVCVCTTNVKVCCPAFVTPFCRFKYLLHLDWGAVILKAQPSLLSCHATCSEYHHVVTKWHMHWEAMGLTYVVSAPGVFCGIAFAFACLLDIGLLDILCGGAFEFFSSGPTKASTAGMNAGTGRTVFLFVIRMLRASCALDLVYLHQSLSWWLSSLYLRSDYSSCVVAWTTSGCGFWELFGFALLILLLGGLLLLYLSLWERFSFVSAP